MLKWLNPELALGFLVATILGAAVLGWQSSYAPTEMEKQQCYEAATKAGHKTEECKSLWEKATSDPVAFFTFVLCIMTAGLVGSTIALWKTTKTAIETAERTTLAVESAYVFAGIGGSGLIITDLRTGSMLLDQRTGKPIVVLSVSAVNYGRTAGLIPTIEWDLCPETKLPPIETKLTYRKRIPVDWTIAPGREGQLQRQIKRVSILKRPHVFYGRVTFTDLLRKHRGTSEFMHLVSPNGAITPIEGRDASSRTYIED
jgi:hypothetical protein